MRIGGQALAEQVLEYLKFRASGQSTTRLLVTDYPSPVLEDMCRSLVHQSGPVVDGQLRYTFGERTVDVALACIQPRDLVEARHLLVEGDYEFGASPDYPVVLRNRPGNVVLAVPPELFDLCHESLKTNSFQAFHENRDFGSDIKVFRRVVQTSFGGREPTQLLAAVLRTIRQIQRAGRGDQGDSEIFANIDVLATSIASGHDLDWRLLGLLPQRQLNIALERVGARAQDVISAVRKNARFQSDLIEGLAKEQYRFVARQYGGKPGFESLVTFLAQREFRIASEDESWRREWPGDLFIEDLIQTRVGESSVGVRALRINAPQVLGIPVVSGAFDINWRLTRVASEVDGEVLIDGDVIALLDLTIGTVHVEEPGPPGRHVIELRGSERIRLSGQTSLSYYIPESDGNLITTIGTSSPGLPSYSVSRNSSFRLGWALLPAGLTAESFVIRVSSRQGEDVVAYELEPSVRWFDFDGGTDESIDIYIEATNSDLARTWTAELHVDVVEQEISGRAIPVATLGSALLDLAGVFPCGENERPPIAIDVEVGDDGFGILFTTENGLFDSRRYRVVPSPALDEFERTFLDSPDSPWPRQLVQIGQGREATWAAIPFGDIDSFIPEIPSAEFRTFIESRMQILGALHDAGGVGKTRLADYSEVIEGYVRSYRDLLACLAAGEESVDRVRIFSNLIDCVVVPREQVSIGEGVQEALPDCSNAMLLVSPTHPLRLSWLCEFERRLENMLAGSELWSKLTFEAVESKNFPPCLVDWNYDHFHAVTTASGGRWSVLFPEGEPEIDQLVPYQLSRVLDLDSPREAAVATPLQLARAVVQYHEIHPYKDAIRIGYVNPGTGQKLLEATTRLIDEPTAQRGNLAQYTAGSCNYDLSLLDVWGTSEDWKMGEAFGAYAEGEADPNVLGRVQYSLWRLESERFASEGTNLPSTHLMFGSDVFRLKGRTEPLRNRAAVPTFGSLILHEQRTFEHGESPCVLTHAFVPRPEEWPARADRVSIGESIHGVLFALQAISAASAERRTVNQTHGRALVAEVDPTTSLAIQRMHELSEWVYLMDSHVDVEYFDQPHLGEQYIIDYVPRLLAASSASRPHNYVITSKDETPIRSVINRFLHSAYDREDVPEHAAERLSKALNSISGRLLLRLSGEPTWAKGAVGLGLVQLLYHSAGMLAGDLRAETRTMRILVPIDDYVSEWLKEYRSIIGTAARGDHADLLDVTVVCNELGASLLFQIIEVKNRRGGYRDGDLRSGPLQQVIGTADILRELFGIRAREVRADKGVKDYQLAQLLDFHLRRAAMRQWGAEPQTLALSRQFRSDTFRAIVSGNYTVPGREMRNVPLLGAIVQFNVGQDYDGAGSQLEFVGNERGSATYVHFGRQEIIRLLAGEPIDALENVRDSLLSVMTAGEEELVEVEDTLEREGAIETVQQPTRTGQVEAPEMEGAASAEEETARQAFVGFVGNRQAIDRIVPWIMVAKRSLPARLSENIALTGHASTGKTELSRRIARALDLPFLQTTGGALGSLDELLGRMRQKAEEDGLPLPEIGREGGLPVYRFPPMVVFIDEAHEISRRVQDELLTLLEPDDRRGTGTQFVADATDITFVLATTEWGRLIPALHTRLQRVPLQSYSQDEVAQIVQNRYPFEWEVCLRLATAGRCLPRVALQRAQELDNALRAYPNTDPMAQLDEYYALWHIDLQGVTVEDRAYLRILFDASGNVGIQRIANQLGVEKREVTQIIEPYLIALGYLEVTGGGRRLTERGIDYIRSLGT